MGRESLDQQPNHPHVDGSLRNEWTGAQEAAKPRGFVGSHRSDPTGRPTSVQLLTCRIGLHFHFKGALSPKLVLQDYFLFVSVPFFRIPFFETFSSVVIAAKISQNTCKSDRLILENFKHLKGICTEFWCWKAWLVKFCSLKLARQFLQIRGFKLSTLCFHAFSCYIWHNWRKNCVSEILFQGIRWGFQRP